MKDKMAKYTMKDFDIEFPDDDTCLEYIFRRRFPDGVKCSECEVVTKHHKVVNRPCYECDYCGHQIYPTAGTIFHKSSTPLRIWFQAMYRMSSTRCGISAKQIQRETGVTYKTAWRMFKQIRKLLNENSSILTNEVEVDESYFGGKAKGKRGRGAENKTAVIGIAQRQGKVVIKVATDTKRSTVMPFIAKNVAQKAIVYTDEYPVYDTVNRLGMRHESVNHGCKEYVNGRVHTNTIESFWSLTKRGIDGVYHAVSPKYLQSYLNEYAFRHNHRNDEQAMFQTFLDQISA